MEPMVLHAELPRFAFKIGFPYWQHKGYTNSKIWLLWKTGWEVEPVACHEQAITIKARLGNVTYFLVSYIYANCQKRVRLELWTHLSSIQQLVTNTSSPWMVAGDFNIIASLNEKRGGRPVDLLGIQEFQDFIGQNELIDA